jgi:hypothetical protein
MMVHEVIINKQILSQEFTKATNELINVLTAFGEDQINKKVSSDSWSAAQVGDHLFKSDSAILKTLYGPVKKTWRSPDENVEDINGTFLDFSTKMKSPELVIPEDMEHDKTALIVALKSTRELLAKAIVSLDLSPTCTDPEMSGIVGEWTRKEYINFVIVHTHRHIHQLKNIFNQTQ